MPRLPLITCLGIALLVAIGGETWAADDQSGYLNTIPDITRVVPPPPHKGDARYEADRRVFRATRSMLHSDRGDLAVRDVAYTLPDLMRDFSCAAGIQLSPAGTPATFHLLAKADIDTQRANEAAKQTWKRLRPFQIDRGPICQSKQELAKSYDYLSGHAAHGWTMGLVLADLIPGRASQLLSRARAYGESRIVCGAHNMSAVEASQLGVAVSLQQVRIDTRYRADFEAAKVELQSRMSGVGAAANGGFCATEQALTRDSILASLPPKAVTKDRLNRPGFAGGHWM